MKIRRGAVLFGSWLGRKREKSWTCNGENLERTLYLQKEGKADFFEIFFLMDASFMEWASRVQMRFAEVLDEKATYLADRSALPFPESWIRLAFKIQAFRCLCIKEEAGLAHIRLGLDHLATFRDLNPADRENLFLVERYREELKALKPGREEENFLSDGRSLKEILRKYARALPTFNVYHAKVEEEKRIYREEFRVFCDGIRKILKK